MIRIRTLRRGSRYPLIAARSSRPHSSGGSHSATSGADWIGGLRDQQQHRREPVGVAGSDESSILPRAHSGCDLAMDAALAGAEPLEDVPGEQLGIGLAESVHQRHRPDPVSRLDEAVRRTRRARSPCRPRNDRDQLAGDERGQQRLHVGPVAVQRLTRDPRTPRDVGCRCPAHTVREHLVQGSIQDRGLGVAPVSAM